MSDISQRQFEQIEDFLLGRMSKEELTSFESHKAQNPIIQFEVERQRELMDAVELGALRERLRTVGKDYDLHADLSGELKTRRFSYAIVASAIAALIAVGALWLKSPTNERLFAQYATAEPGIFVAQHISERNTFYRAMREYQNEHYTAVINDLSEQLNAEPHNDTLLFYLANAHFNSGHFLDAITFHERILQEGSSAYRDKSQWYLVLCWLQTKEYDKINALANDDASEFGRKISTIKKALKDQV